MYEKWFAWNWPISSLQKNTGELSIFTLCFGGNTVFLTQIYLVHCVDGIGKLILHCFVPSEIRSGLRNGASPVVIAKTHDIGSLSANTCLVLKVCWYLECSWSRTCEPRQNQQSDCVPREDSDQPGHQSLCWADAQADLSLRWAHSHFVGLVMSRLMLWCYMSFTYIKLLRKFNLQCFQWAIKCLRTP